MIQQKSRQLKRPIRAAEAITWQDATHHSIDRMEKIIPPSLATLISTFG